MTARNRIDTILAEDPDLTIDGYSTVLAAMDVMLDEALKSGSVGMGIETDNLTRLHNRVKELLS